MTQGAVFSSTQLEGIARQIARMDNILPKSIIARKVAEIGIERTPSFDQSKWAYLLQSFEIWQDENGTSEKVLEFIRQAMKHLIYNGTATQVAELQEGLNRILNDCGLTVLDDGIIGDEILAVPIAKETTSSDLPSGDSPPALQESITRFQTHHPYRDRTGFIIMRFGKEKPLVEITSTIKTTLTAHGLTAVRADEKRYHDLILSNVETYMRGCGFGIAVFERFKSDDHNANVALEVGYMLALGKPVCLLKDRTVTTLQADLLGMIYDEFDPSDITRSVQEALEKWLRDKELVP